MADIATAVRAVLVADSPVNTAASGGVFPDVLPQGATYPAIRYSLVTEESVGHLSGKEGVAEAVISIDCYAATRLAATDLSDKVRLALDRYRGTISSVNILSSYVGTGSHTFREPPDNSDVGVYRANRDYRLFFVETT